MYVISNLPILVTCNVYVSSMDSLFQAMGMPSLTLWLSAIIDITSINLFTINSFPFAFICTACLANKFLSDNTLISWNVQTFVPAATQTCTMKFFTLDLKSPRKWFCVNGRVLPDISQDCSAFTFRVEQFKKTEWWRHHDCSKCHELCIQQHGATS